MSSAVIGRHLDLLHATGRVLTELNRAKLRDSDFNLAVDNVTHPEVRARVTFDVDLWITLGTVGTLALVYIEIQRDRRVRRDTVKGLWPAVPRLCAWGLEVVQPSRVSRSVKENLASILRVPAPGLTGCTVAQVVGLAGTSTNLLVPFPWEDTEGVRQGRLGSPGLVDSLITELTKLSETNAEAPEARTLHRYLILGGPGTGKSTLAYALLSTLAAGHSGRVMSRGLPIYLRLGDYRGQIQDRQFGTPEWLLEHIQKQSGHSSLRIRDILDDTGTLRRRWVLILDALDELLMGVEPSLSATILSGFVLTNASVVTCGKQFYERYLALSPFSQPFNKIELLQWTDTEQDEFIDKYYEKLGAHGSASVSELKHWCGEFPYRRELCATPLRLAMAVDVAFAAREGLLGVTGKIDLFREFTQRQLSQQTQAIPLDLKMQLLEMTAWQFYAEDAVGNESRPFTRGELESEVVAAFCAQHAGLAPERILDDLEQNSFIDVRAEPKHVAARTVLSFTHKSFQNYFVAMRIVHAIRAGAKEAVRAFSKFCSAEVAEFLMEAVTKLREDLALSQAVENLQDAYNLTAGSDPLVELRPERRRIAHQQIGFYLGTLATPSGDQAFLEKQLDCEPDLWVRRGIVVGLALGGSTKPMTNYINRLREQRTAQVAVSENEASINLGYHLSFFGDQHLRIAEPYRDQELATSDNTVAALLDILSSPTMATIHRLCLFTLVDLGRFRPEGFQSACEARREQIEQLKLRLEASPESRGWPELPELIDLLGRPTPDSR